MDSVRLTIVLALTFLGNGASAALVVSNWSATATTLEFDITGTIDPGVTFGPVQQNALFVGPANLPEQVGAITVSGTWTSLGGTPTVVNSADLYNDSGSPKIQIRKSGSWAVGDTLNYSFSFSDPLLVDLSGFDTTGAIVAVGRDVYVDAPEAAFQVGTFGAEAVKTVPTASTYGLMFMAIGLLVLAGHRLRARL